MENGMGLTPLQIASGFTIGQLVALTQGASKTAADPFALAPGERVLTGKELAERIRKRKAAQSRGDVR